MAIFREFHEPTVVKCIRKASAGLRFFPLAMAGGLRHQRPAQACPLPTTRSRWWFSYPFSLREGRNPTIIMANQSTTRPSNQPTPKRVAKSASSQSLNHLLNFSLPPRQTQQVQSLPRRSRRHGAAQGVWNKEREAVFRLERSPAMITIHPLFRLC